MAAAGARKFVTTNRYHAALEGIAADKKAGKMADRAPVAADFARRRALRLPPSAQFDEILKAPKDGNLGATLTAAMEEIERASPPLAGQLSQSTQGPWPGRRDGPLRYPGRGVLPWGDGRARVYDERERADNPHEGLMRDPICRAARSGSWS